VFTRLSALAISAIAYLTVAGYMAIEAYLSDVGLEASIAPFGKNGLVHYGLIVFDKMAGPLMISAAIYVALAYFRYLIDITDTPYHDIYLRKDNTLDGFTYWATKASTEANRSIFKALLDGAQLMMLVVLVLESAFAGNAIGNRMAIDTLQGVATFDSALVNISQRVHLTLVPHTRVSEEVQSANLVDKLNIIWDDPETVSVAVVTPPSQGLPEHLNIATISRSAIVSIERFRTIEPKVSNAAAKATPRASGAAAPKSSSNVNTKDPGWVVGVVNYLGGALILAAMTVVIILYVKTFRKERSSTVVLRPLATADAARIELPLADATRAADAIARGRDLRFVPPADSMAPTILVRNAYYRAGHVLELVAPASDN